MRKIINNIVIVCLLGLAQGVSADNLGLITGSKKGTYIQIGQDISRLMKREGVELNVYESKGSLENIAAVFEKDDVQMGLVQSDVLGYLRESQNRKLEDIEEKIKMMFPLYNEEVHLLARKGIRSIHDLNNKKVGVGSRGSGTNLTSDLLFEVTNVWPQRKYHLDARAALRALDEGAIDALIYVSGYPVKLFENVDGERFHLLSLNNERISEYYLASSIPENTYGWQSGVVNTIAVKAVLMSFDFDGEYCQTAKKITNTIYNNMKWLNANGHSKWKEVDLDYSLNRWDRYRCVSGSNVK